MNIWDESSISKPVVDSGISQWNTMAGEQDRECRALLAEVERCLDTAPWGTQAEGRAFLRSHLADGGPAQMVSECKKLLKGIIDAGDGVRLVVDRTLAAHADMAADMLGEGRKVMEV